MTYGPEISRDHPQLGWDDECPKWLEEDERCDCQNSFGTWMLASNWRKKEAWSWPDIKAIRLPSDHWVYQTVDWSKPLRAINCKTGVWEDVERDYDCTIAGTLDGGGWFYQSFNPDGQHASPNCPYLIRNRPDAPVEGVSEELVERMVALVREMAPLWGAGGHAMNGEHYHEASLIDADLPEEKPDPLEEVLRALPEGIAHCVDGADRIRTELAKRGMQIVELAGEAGE